MIIGSTADLFRLINTERKKARWLEQQIKKEEFKSVSFPVAIMHVPPYHAGGLTWYMECRRLFNPQLNMGKIDLLIATHTHRSGYLNQMKRPTIIPSLEEEGLESENEYL